MQFSEVISASVQTDGRVAFIVEDTKENQYTHYIPSSLRAFDDGCKAWLEDNTPTLDSETIYEKRRIIRRDMFSNTIDRMNPVWWSQLTTAQQQSFHAFRQVWLDYPANGTIPETIDITIDGTDYTDISTDVSDIFT